MFEKNYDLVGRHSVRARFLKEDAKLFKSFIDVYKNGAIWGLLYNRTAQKDREISDNLTIFSEQFSNHRDDCIFLYRLVMLLDETTELDSQARLDRAFRDDAEDESEEKEQKMKANLEIFNSYVRGGIDQLYEDLITDCTTSEDYITRVQETITNFKDTLPGVDLEDRLAKLLGE